MRRRLFLCLAAVFWLSTGAPAWGLPIVDDFEAGPFTLVDVAPGGNEVSNLSGLPTANVIGGARFASTFLNDGNSLSASVPSSAGDDALTVVFGVGSRGWVDLRYGSFAMPLNADVASQGGNAFVVSVLAATPEGSPFTSGLLLSARDTSSNQGAGFLPFTGPGVYVFPFAEFFQFVAMDSVREISLQVRSFEPPLTTRTYTISAITVEFVEGVPEPVVGALLALGLARVLGPALRGRRA